MATDNDEASDIKILELFSKLDKQAVELGIAGVGSTKRFIAETRGYKCEVCSVSDWQGKPITLHVDHVNGDPSNDRPDNLRLICPNCHSQTEFLGGGNKGRGRGSLGIAKY